MVGKIMYYTFKKFENAVYLFLQIVLVHIIQNFSFTLHSHNRKSGTVRYASDTERKRELKW